ncbi:TPA: LemA family protein [Candidatus Nomurabacteria bacterium]|nr:MAG: LemA-like protein [Parcubacteria bacterium RAAC4_OD1_1]HCY26535.1 LemA family protein [Candidatus Nomurabacteria bacterium]
MIVLYIILGVIVLLGFYLVAKYNGFITLRNRTEEAWADIDVQLKRRYDLIPNLVNTVKGYASHESSVFEKVTEARANSINAEGKGDKAGIAQAENMLSGALKSLFAIAEAYPDLKANTNFLELQKELADTENKIMASRRFYNGNVRDFNTGVQMFPASIVASMFNFKALEFFELEQDDIAKNPVEVKF